MKMLILTGYDRNMAELAELCLPSKQAWAKRWGVEIRVLKDTYPTDYPAVYGHPSFQKLRHIRWWLEHYDVVFWMDADSVITNQGIIPQIMAQAVIDFGNWPFAVSADYKRPEEDPRPWWNLWSAGHMIWMKDPRSFQLLDAAMNRTEFMWSGLWDQDALQACLDGPEDCRGPQIRPPRALNSVVPGLTGWDQADWQPGDFLCHFTGIRHEDRVKVARTFISNLNLLPPTV